MGEIGTLEWPNRRIHDRIRDFRLDRAASGGNMMIRSPANGESPMKGCCLPMFTVAVIGLLLLSRAPLPSQAEMDKGGYSPDKIRADDRAIQPGAEEQRVSPRMPRLRKVAAAASHRPDDEDEGAPDDPRRGGSGNCCFYHTTPGCEDPVCEASVCLWDPYCCNLSWHEDCATRALADPNCNCTGGGCTPDYTVTAPYTSVQRSTCFTVDDCDLSPSEDRIYEVTIPSSGDWTFSLCASFFDTVLYLGTTCCGNEMGSDDDGCGVTAGPSVLNATLAAGTYWVTIEGYAAGDCGDYILEITRPCLHIPADSTCDTSVKVEFCFVQDPGFVSFSVDPPGCGSVDPTGMLPTSNPPCSYYVSTDYHPCETEGLTVTVTADPSNAIPNETKTVCLDPREDIDCGQQYVGCVATFNEQTGAPEEALVEVVVCEPEGCGGSVNPVAGMSQYDAPSGLWIFCSTYTPDPCAGRVNLRFWLPPNPDTQIYFSLDQSCDCPATPPAPTPPPNPCGPQILTCSGSPPVDVTWYWQGMSCGTSIGLGSCPSGYTADLSGTYYIRARHASGCWSTDCGSVTVTVNEVPDTPTDASADPPGVCAGQSSTLTATVGAGGDALEWFEGSCGGAIVPGQSPVVSPIVTTDYFVHSIVTVTGCVSPCSQVTVAVDSGPCPFHGDMNCDGMVDGRDVAPFVLALIDPVGYGQVYPGCDIARGDMNDDGLVDVGDLGMFLDALLGTCGALKGDVNCDRVVDGLDIRSFVMVALGQDLIPGHFEAADLDGNGIVDAGDVLLFTDLLIFGGGPLMGDVNGDRVIDGLDVRFFIMVALGQDLDPDHVRAADFDGNGIVDEMDVPQFILTLMD